MTDFNTFIANQTEMEVRSASLDHIISGDYPDADIEYPLLVGLILNATEPSVIEKLKSEPEAPKKNDETLNPKTPKVGWLDRIKQLSIFEEPDGATIQD